MGSAIQYSWDRLLDKVGDDPFNIYVLGTIAISWTTYSLIGSLYTFMDVTNKPKFLRKYKTQPNTNEPVAWNRLLKVILVVNFNLTVVPFLVGALGYPIMKYYDLNLVNPRKALPSPPEIIYQLLMIVLVEEIGFYYTHRLFHHPLLYKHIHKRHHEWQSPISISAIYAHPLEHAICNVTPIALGPVLMNSHVIVMHIWIVITVVTTLTDHSGYHLPICKSPEFHDYHHLKFNECYGVLGLLDYLHGTSVKYRKSKCYTRDKILMSLTPVRETYPDDKKKR